MIGVMRNGECGIGPRRRKNMARFTALMGAMVLAAMSLSARAADPASGTWELNVARSKFIPSSLAPRSQTRTYKVEADRETAHHTGIDARGNPTLIDFTAAYDGKDYPLKGYEPHWDSISMKKVDEYTTEFTQSRAGKASLFGKRVVSQDGLRMTVTAEGTSADGEPVHLAMEFDRKK
jgi:hypothetical protein